MGWYFPTGFFGEPVPQPQPQVPQSKLFVEWGLSTGMITYTSMSPLYDAEHKIPHLTRNMEEVISLAAKRGGQYAR